MHPIAGGGHQPIQGSVAFGIQNARGRNGQKIAGVIQIKAGPHIGIKTRIVHQVGILEVAAIHFQGIGVDAKSIAAALQAQIELVVWGELQQIGKADKKLGLGLDKTHVIDHIKTQGHLFVVGGRGKGEHVGLGRILNARPLTAQRHVEKGGRVQSVDRRVEHVQMVAVEGVVGVLLAHSPLGEQPQKQTKKNIVVVFHRPGSNVIG